jgi:adenylate cyclase
MRNDHPAEPPGHAADWTTTFERSLQHETLRTECRRTTLTVGVLVFLLLLALTLRLRPQWVVAELREPYHRLFWPLSALLATYAVYEAGIRCWQARLLRAGQSMPPRIRYLHVLAEVSLPTLALMLGAGFFGPHQALASSVPYVYFLLVFLTALNLDARLCAFAGMAAGAQFVLLSLLLLGLGSGQAAAVASSVPVLVAPHQYFIKALLLAVSGLLAAFVASRIRSQVEVALRTVEERDRAVSIFGQHVSPQVAEILLKQPLPASGEEHNVCVMFLDIRDFSRIAAARTAPEVMDYLNRLFGFMIPLVNRHHGIVNKFLGDGFMAVFGAPVKDGEQCQHAVDTAFEILRGVDRLNQGGDIPPTRVGIGLHMGKAVTGNVGSSDRKEYTIIGDVVNLASRVEQATKQFGAQLLVTETVWGNLAPLGKYPVEDLGPVELKGHANPVRLFELA